MTRIDGWILFSIRIFNILCSRKRIKKKLYDQRKKVVHHHHLEMEITSIHSKQQEFQILNYYFLILNLKGKNNFK